MKKLIADAKKSFIKLPKWQQKQIKNWLTIKYNKDTEDYSYWPKGTK